MSKEAMKLALEALTKVDALCPVGSNEEIYVREAIYAITEALAKQEQGEPVTWRNAAIRVGEDLCSVGPFGYYDMTAEQWLDWALSVVTVHLPPQPAQKPLTDEQILRLLSRIDECAVRLPKGLREFARAIEAAHGIKE